MKKIKYLAVAATLFFAISACNKDDKKTAGMSHLNVRMTDAPGQYDAVLIDVQQVEVTGSGGGAVMLNTQAGIYDLLALSNGVDTLLAAGDLAAGEVSQIRLILGPNNSVIVNGVSHPLSTPSAQQSGLKVQVHKTFEPGVTYAVLLDFDANQSIVEQGNGNYSLKPVIRTIEVALNGAIRGSITPIGALVAVTATSNGVSYSSATNANGEFLLSGLPAGTYDVTLTPAFPSLPITVSGVVVTTGTTSNIGVVAF
ncbi:MAG: DUF4382 domain-containing protein [Chitinophagales bacterium]|nr:DUF4382 domain-containing protein [Chitinophagales bacterium]